MGRIGPTREVARLELRLFRFGLAFAKHPGRTSLGRFSSPCRTLSADPAEAFIIKVIRVLHMYERRTNQFVRRPLIWPFDQNLFGVRRTGGDASSLTGTVTVLPSR